MSEFSTEWLDLRAPADEAARSPEVLTALQDYFSDHDAITACDLGSGTGATVRGIAQSLPSQQRWVLMDQDEKHLAVAEDRINRWVENVQFDGALDLRQQVTDLVVNCTPWPDATALVTASALFDLVSASWLDRFVAALTTEGKPLLALLTYDGRLGFEPALPGDQVMVDAFNQHQQTDKGFGPALGPNASAYLISSLEQAGYKVVQGDSAWRLTNDFKEMRQALITGWATAAAEVGVAADTIKHWRQAHWSADDLLTVGHLDLFAYPAG